MPFKSAKQRKYLHIHEPKIAKEWEDEAKKNHTSPVQPTRKKKKT